jgi:adenine-specific DNA-methyltransferase
VPLAACCQCSCSSHWRTSRQWHPSRRLDFWTFAAHTLPKTARREALTTTSATTIRFPTTRYQGSKRKLTGAILAQLENLEFTTALDAFAGTGAVAHSLKNIRKHVTYNDALAFNHQIGLALIENDTVTISDADIMSATSRHPGIDYDNFIEQTFDDIYFTSEENTWLDVTTQNIRRVECKYKRAMLFYALFQSAMIKRPYNLFHRKNLYMRTANVERSFGNKATWDRPFPDHFTKFAREANAAIINTNGTCNATCRDALAIEETFDLVYIDPPYVSGSTSGRKVGAKVGGSVGVGVDYHHFYHFLEGMTRYADWPTLVDQTSKHRRLKSKKNPWCDGSQNAEMFSNLFERFEKSILVISYRSDGTPSIHELRERLARVKRNVTVIEGKRYQYALSTNRKSHEVLLIGK